MSQNPLLSVVIPVYNEAESLPHLKEALDKVILRENLDAEYIFINDGSDDGTIEILDKFTEDDNKVYVKHFRRNQGKAAALDLGFGLSRGNYIITMDADLQDDPEEIPNLIDKLEEGFDLVSGWKKKRYDPITKTLPSKFFNFIARMFSKAKLHDFNCGLKIYRREVFDSIRIYGELHRYIPVLAAAQGYKVGELVVKHHPRKWGTTKYGYKRFLFGFLDLLSVIFLTRFTSSPMHLFGTIGLLLGLAGLGVFAYLVVGWFQQIWIGDRPLFFVSILLMIVGVQFFSLGLIGEMISNMRIASQKRLTRHLDQDE